MQMKHGEYVFKHYFKSDAKINKKKNPRAS